MIRFLLTILSLALLFHCEGDRLTEKECLGTAALIYSLEKAENNSEENAQNIALLRAISCKK